MECFQAGRCNGTCSAIQHVPRKVNTQISQRWTHDQRCDTDSNNHFSFFSWRRGISQYNVSCRESNISCLLGTGVLVLLYIYELHSPVLYSHLQKSWVKSNETLWKVNFYFDVSSIFENASKPKWWIDLIFVFFFFWGGERRVFFFVMECN